MDKKDTFARMGTFMPFDSGQINEKLIEENNDLKVE